MPHSRTAKKNLRKSEKNRAHNRALNSTLKTELKRVRTSETAAEAAAALPHAQKLIDKAAKNSRIHKNKAARVKSRLAKAANRI